jgi:hypothetical protein
MKKLGLALSILTVLALITTACNLTLNPPVGPDGPQPGQPQQEQPQPGQPGEPQPGQPGGPQLGEPQPGQPGEPQPGEPQPGQPGEPQPGEPQPPPPTEPQPGSGGGCAGAPVVPYFNASPTSITSGQSSSLSWGTITNGATGPMVASTTIQPGLGEVGSGASSRTVSPTKTTTYTLTATGCGGTVTRQVTVIVSSSGGGKSPTSTPISNLPVIPAQVYKLDLAMTNIYPASTGKIMFTIKNTGTVAVSGSYKVVCNGSYMDSSGNHALTASGQYANVNLSAGQKTDYETGYSRNPSITSMWVSCKLTPPAADEDKSNDEMGMTQVK